VCDGGDDPAVRDHGDVAVAVGAGDRDVQLGEGGQQRRRRMPVVVTGTGTDHRHAGADRGKELRREVGRAMVRHLQHVRVQVGAGVQHRLLCLDLGVARQQDA
jgi:hypothetical protein